MSKFFIDRPIFAWVIALVLMLGGVLAIKNLPVNQYPDIAPPAVAIVTSYPGASAQTVQDTVTQVIEQQLNGLDGLRYISSESNTDGSMVIIVTFEQGTDPDIAQVQVQNKLQLATPMLPEEVQRVQIQGQLHADHGPCLNRRTPDGSGSWQHYRLHPSGSHRADARRRRLSLAWCPEQHEDLA